MSGLYNALFGMNPDRDKLLSLLGLSVNDFYRFRDCYLTEDGQIAVYTRGGGGNRDDHEDPRTEFGNNPNFLGAEDDDFDCTYMTYTFKVPDEAKAVLEGMEPTLPPAEKWSSLLASLNR